jgi:hypothetical protein
MATQVRTKSQAQATARCALHESHRFLGMVAIEVLNGQETRPIKNEDAKVLATPRRPLDHVTLEPSNMVSPRLPGLGLGVIPVFIAASILEAPRLSAGGRA